MLNAVQDTNICIPVPNFYLDMRLSSSYEGSSLLLCGLYIGKPSNRMSQACYVLKFSECESFSWQWDFIKGAKFVELLYYWVYFSLRLYPPVICNWGLRTVVTKRNCKALCKVSRAGGVRRKIPKVKLNESPSPDVFLFFLFLPFCDVVIFDYVMIMAIIYKKI
jgi:hypothetical protein